jgi:hypothetical protein
MLSRLYVGIALEDMHATLHFCALYSPVALYVIRKIIVQASVKELSRNSGVRTASRHWYKTIGTDASLDQLCRLRTPTFSHQAQMTNEMWVTWET